MCGIAGFNWENKSLIDSMYRILQYRGPDSKGIFLDKKVSLGHQRLAILDLSKAGKQPMSNEKETAWITFNGEIYNFRELRKKIESKHRFKSNTDTEVIIHLYEEFGFDFLSFIEGDFAFCIYDSDKKILFLARDRIGVKPLYYYKKDDKFIFASEIKAILQDKEIDREINKEALNKFISLRYIPGRQTIFNNICRLMAGEYLVYSIKDNKVTIKKYWDMNTNPKKKKYAEKYYAENVLELLKKSVKKRLISDVPLGAYLSGGIDSSAIVALMHKIKKEENDKEGIKTFSVGFEKGEYANELPYAKKVSELFGTEHKEIVIKTEVVELLQDIIWHLDEPMADPALMPVYLLSKYAKKDVSVILTGDGGDEVFAGYDQYKFLRLGNKLKYIPFADKISCLMKILPLGILNRIHKYSSKMGRDSFKKVDLMISSFKKNSPSKAYYELMSLINDSEREELLKEEYFNNFDYKSLNQRYFTTKQDYLNQLLYFDIKNLLSEGYLMKTDRMTMAHAVEARVPFLDHKLVQFAYNIPSRLKLNKGISKYILKKSLSGLLPKDIIYRKKQTFHVPIDNWIKKDLKEHVNLLLNEKEINKMGLFNYRQINKIFKNYNKGELFYARQIWNLICFKIWYNKFII